MTSIRSNDGTEIGYDRRGTGPPLIIVAGATAYRAIAPSEDQLAELLGADFTVFRYDRRGRGESGDKQPYAVEREIEDLGALIDEAGGSAIALGFSSGAVLALETAEAGLPFTGLALYEPPFIVDDSRPAMPADYVSRLRELVAADRRADASEYFLQQAVGLPREVVAGMPTERRARGGRRGRPHDRERRRDHGRHDPRPAAPRGSLDARERTRPRPRRRRQPRLDAPPPRR